MLEPSKQFRFEKTINLGHILSALSMAGAVMLSASYFDRRVTIVELKQSYADKSLELLTAQNKGLNDNQIVISKSLERITTILEERTPKK